MNHIVFNTENEAISLNNRINSALSSVWSDGITNNYCVPQKHPTLDLWGVVIQPGYESYFTPQELADSVELTQDWIYVPLIE